MRGVAWPRVSRSSSIGLYGFLTQALDIDFSVIFDYWYVVIMGFGGWLIYNGLQSRKNAETAGDSL